MIMTLESVNFHFYPYCNFRCAYCFARFKNVNIILSKKECFKIISDLTRNGTQKLNFVGGEPTLCPFLGELVVFAKQSGLTTSIVSNGTGITPKFIATFKNSIDWIGLSLDSGIEEVQKVLGRGDGTLVQDIINKSKMVKNAGIKLKINSVITRLNYAENISNVIEQIKPDRWKVFQALEIEGQNNNSIKNLLITQAEFENFIKRHEFLKPIAENNDVMTNSYVMIDPEGKFFQNSGNRYIFSKPILEVGMLQALEDIEFDRRKLVERGGIYAW